MSVSIRTEDIFNTLRSISSNVTQQEFNFCSYWDSRGFSFTVRYISNGYKAKNSNIVTNERLGF